MLILKEATWEICRTLEKKVRKNADLSPGLSRLLSLDLFLLIVLERKKKNVKNTKKDKTTHKKGNSRL